MHQAQSRRTCAPDNSQAHSRAPGDFGHTVGKVSHYTKYAPRLVREQLNPSTRATPQELVNVRDVWSLVRQRVVSCRDDPSCPGPAGSGPQRPQLDHTLSHVSLSCLHGFTCSYARAQNCVLKLHGIKSSRLRFGRLQHQLFLRTRCHGEPATQSPSGRIASQADPRDYNPK